MAAAQKAAGVLGLLAEGVALIWALTMSFLLTVWMEGDAFAAQATETGWWIEAGRRMTVAVVAAGMFSIATYFVSRHAFRWAGINNDRAALLTAAAATLLLIAAAAAGAITFVVKKPFIYEVEQRDVQRHTFTAATALSSRRGHES